MWVAMMKCIKREWLRLGNTKLGAIWLFDQFKILSKRKYGVVCF